MAGGGGGLLTTFWLIQWAQAVSKWGGLSRDEAAGDRGPFLLPLGMALKPSSGADAAFFIIWPTAKSKRLQSRRADCKVEGPTAKSRLRFFIIGVTGDYCNTRRSTGAIGEYGFFFDARWILV